MNLGKIKVFDFKLGDTLGACWEEQIKIWQGEDEDNDRVITSMQCIPNKTKFGDYMTILLTYLEVPGIRNVTERLIPKKEVRKAQIEKDERTVNESNVSESTERVGLIFRNMDH